MIAPDSEACVPRTASRTEFECLAANFQSLKGPKREPLWKLVICWWDWELKFGAWVGNKGTHHLFCFSVYTICVCNRVYIYRIIYEIYMHTQRKAILPDRQVLRDTARLSWLESSGCRVKDIEVLQWRSGLLQRLLGRNVGSSVESVVPECSCCWTRGTYKFLWKLQPAQLYIVCV